jgi:ribonuclease BN (tRNA processing enzyme)
MPAYGYRFEFPDRTIVFSGDTAPDEAVAKLATGADVLVHETMDVPGIEAQVRRAIARGYPTTLEVAMDHLRADHTPTEDVGRIAQEAGVKTLVLSHFAPGDDSVSDAEWRSAAAKHFKGEIIVGRDLMVI